jgi:hypothetical protein
MQDKHVLVLDLSRLLGLHQHLILALARRLLHHANLARLLEHNHAINRGLYDIHAQLLHGKVRALPAKSMALTCQSHHFARAADVHNHAIETGACTGNIMQGPHAMWHTNLR